MPIIVAKDLYTHIYPEVIDEITRTDSSVADHAIATAIQEVKMYLSRYDLVQLFGVDSADAGSSVPAAITDEYLDSIVKDVACWHLLRLSNVSIDYKVFRTAYEDAITALKNIMTGQAQPQGWPYLDTAAAAPPPDGDAISWSSNPRRNNYY